MDPATTIASLGGSLSYRVTPGERPRPQSLRQMRRADRLSVRLGKLAAVACSQGDAHTQFLMAHNSKRLSSTPRLPVFSAR